MTNVNPETRFFPRIRIQKAHWKMHYGFSMVAVPSWLTWEQKEPSCTTYCYVHTHTTFFFFGKWFMWLFLFVCLFCIFLVNNAVGLCFGHDILWNPLMQSYSIFATVKIQLLFMKLVSLAVLFIGRDIRIRNSCNWEICLCSSNKMYTVKLEMITTSYLILWRIFTVYSAGGNYNTAILGVD